MSKHFQIFSGILSLIMGVGILALHSQGHPTLARAKYIRALHEAKAQGKDPAKVVAPPISKQWHFDWTHIILSSAWVMFSIAILIRICWKQKKIKSPL